MTKQDRPPNHLRVAEPSEIEPHNQEAEEHIAGAVMDPILGPTALAESREHIAAHHFWIAKAGLVFDAACRLSDDHQPHDVISVSTNLRQNSQLTRAGGEAYLHELVAGYPTATNAGYYAKIVLEQSHARRAFAVAKALKEAVLNGGLKAHPEIVIGLQELLDAPSGLNTLRPLWWKDAMVEPIPDTSEYVEDVLQAGVLTDIVGLPYLHKTAIALELAVKISRGSGNFLGRFPITAQANVAYFWADDSRAKELERIQQYGQAHSLDAIPLGMYLNPGVNLPEDLPTIKGQIKQHNYRVVIFDSLYNFAPSMDWAKDAPAVTALYASLKRCCDEIEGLTIILVDHAAKPSDSNKGRSGEHSSYGSVFKAASVRSTISVEKERHKLYVSAAGNNIKGFKRTAAFFAEEQLEVRLQEDTSTQTAEVAEAVEQMIREEILTHLRAHPGDSTNKIREGVRRSRGIVQTTLNNLEREGIIVDENALIAFDKSAPEGSEARSGALHEDHVGEPRPRLVRRGQAQSWQIVHDPLGKAA